jgi:glycogen(starch) synthase
MRILVLSNLYPPNVVGGYERLCFEVTSGLAQAGHDMVVLTSRYGGEVEDFPGQRIRREWDLLIGANIYAPFPGTPGDRAAINVSNQATLSRVLAEERPDVVFAWNLFFLDASLLDALQQSGIRTVVMLTDNWLLVMRNPGFVHNYFQNVVFGDEPDSAPAIGASPPGALQRLKAVFRSRALPVEARPGIEAVFGSAFMRDFYAAGGQRFARDRVIHNGVQQHRYACRQPPDRSVLVDRMTLRLLFAGRLVDLKGAHTAVAALQLLDPAALGVSRVTLTLLGDAQDQAYMARLATDIRESGCADDIELRSSVPLNALPELFDAYDVYLFPSLYEPFSLTLIHALALGIPTIASAAGGNGEIVRDGESGLLFKKGDAQSLAAAISRLAAEGALRTRLAKGGIEAASKFTYERMVSEMAAFLSPQR